MENQQQQGLDILGADEHQLEEKGYRKERANMQEEWSQIFPPPEEPMHVEWKDVTYAITKKKGSLGKRVAVKRYLTKNMSGSVAPGELVAIMGPSGAGKTTLLNILAGRIARKKYTGQITINGVPRNKQSRLNTAFVLQEDLFFSEISVKNTLRFTAQMVMPKNLSVMEKNDRVDRILKIFKLEKCAGTAVGNNMRRGISGGEKKRLNIANELLKGTSLVLLDEPTTGLDASTAMDVVSILSLIAKSGRTVITTIHQPSSQMLPLFDKLLLLSDGRVAYHGPTSRVVEYFSKIGYDCPHRYNPADFLMEMMDENKNSEGVMTTENRDRILDLWDGNRAEYEKHTPPEDLPPPIKTKKGPKWPTSYFFQFWLLYVRASIQYVPAAIMNAIVFFIIVVVAMICFYQLGHKYEDMNNRNGLVFFILLQWFVFPMFTVINTFIPERTILMKERSAGQYRLSAYFWAKSIAELIIDLPVPITFCALLYWTANLRSGADHFFILTAIIYIMFLCGQSVGLFIAAFFDKVEKASPISLVYFFIAMLIAGFYVTIDSMPDWFSWLQYTVPLKYAYDAVLVNEFDGAKFHTTYLGQPFDVEGSDYIDSRDPILTQIWANALIVIGFTLLFRILAYMALRFTTRTVQ
eukprot:TRINITY_DN12927_c0_g1_i1.p1 TRINITY_DN12927_c0_g1~~TRINITY_DN12927_c0_g1_i1.p1  ORF type:complete len:664 (+),score=111.53 TRINITY_DN12927_c0_g1_i1:83-1993(+)